MRAELSFAEHTRRRINEGTIIDETSLRATAEIALATGRGR